jgi:alkyl hydroperoxide reductase subunit AhpF
MELAIQLVVIIVEILGVTGHQQQQMDDVIEIGRQINHQFLFEQQYMEHQ